jgi:exocyst complex component 8
VILRRLLIVFVDVAKALRDASEEEIEAFQRELRQLKSRADTDIQHNVFANREQFIKISKEAEKLKGEMRTIRSLMSDLTSTLGQVTVTGAGGTSGSLSVPDSYSSIARKRSNRSSVANLEALWSSHLQELWRRVEGSQKYLPAIPGRHVVYESGRWVELNSATWKPRRKVHLILLNDHLLIAAEKKKPQEATKDPKDKQPAAQLIALKCWPLQDVQIADLNMRVKPGTADPDASGNSINIRVGAESMTFATASKEIREKLSLLSNFRKSSEDLRRKLETETQQQERTQESVNGLSSPFLKTNFLADSVSSGFGHKADILVDVDGKQVSLRRVDNEIDDLDIKIALQVFDEAVELWEKLRRIVKGIRGNATAHTLLSTKLDDRASKLATIMLKYLTDTHGWLTSTQKNVDWLTRLGYEDRAREAYLKARTKVIQKRIR